MTKRVLEVGNCDMDHSSISSMIQQHFNTEIVRVHGEDDALTELAGNDVFDLVLVNRVFDRDGGSGLELIRKLKSIGEAEVPVMLITNFAEHQESAKALGAESGFGKSEINSPQTVSLLKNYLD